MAYSYFAGSGYVTYTEEGQTPNGNKYYKIGVSVRTGEQKQDGDEYYPSNMVNATFWGNQATALAKQEYLCKGAKVILSGQMGVPYVKEGTTQAIIQLNYPSIEVVQGGEGDTGSGKQQAAASSSKAKSKVTLEDDEDLF